MVSYFKSVPEIGPLLASKMLGMALLAFMGILLLSNLIGSLSTFFLARDLDMLRRCPGGMGPVLPGQARGNRDPCLVDGRAARGSAAHRVCHRLAWRADVRPGGRRRTHSLVRHSRGHRVGDYADSRERLSRPPDSRHPRPGHGGGGRRAGDVHPPGRSGTARAAGGIPEPGGLRRGPSDAVTSAATERVGAGHDHELADASR